MGGARWSETEVRFSWWSNFLDLKTLFCDLFWHRYSVLGGVLRPGINWLKIPEMLQYLRDELLKVRVGTTNCMRLSDAQLQAYWVAQLQFTGVSHDARHDVENLEKVLRYLIEYRWLPKFFLWNAVYDNYTFNIIYV